MSAPTHIKSATNNSVSLVLAAGAILLVNIGARQSLGLFVGPLNDHTGIGLPAISFAFAVSQIVWGVVQPVYGALADRIGTFRLICFGAVLVALGTGLTPFARSSPALVLCLGVLSAAGAGAGSFAILIGWIAQYLPESRRSFAAGFINAGASLGQFVFAPITQFLINHTGWDRALFVLAASALLTIPLAAVLDRYTHAAARARTKSSTDTNLRTQLKQAFRDPNYLYLQLGFFTCGFHIGFLVTHLPGEVALCSLSAQVSANALALIGLFNIGGSLGAGVLCQHWRMKHVLSTMYLSRAVLIVAFMLAPKTPWVFYAFAASLGLTWLATVPPTAGLVGKFFGPRHLATLFGLALVTHQVGGFFGAWLGGVTRSRFGDYHWMWYVDAALALFAAAINLPIRESHPLRAARAAE